MARIVMTDGVVDAAELAELRRRPDIVMAIYSYGPIWLWLYIVMARIVMTVS